MSVALEQGMFQRAVQAKCCNAVVAGVVSLCCLTPRLAAAADHAASAEEKPKQVPAPAGTVHLSVLAGFGYGDGVELGDNDYLGVGYGVRAGYTSGGTPLYLGGTLLRYEGPSGGSYQLDFIALDFELGYEITAGPIVFRPYLGLGALAGVSSLRNGASAEGGETGNSAILPHAVPGLLIWHSIGIVAIGAEARYEPITNGHDGALALMGSVGAGF